MNTLIQTLKYFVTITAELVVLFILIRSIIDLILQYIPEEKIQNRLSGKGIIVNIIGAGFGALTPFCACSTIPMTIGFLNAKVPFGSAMSFLISSPLLNPIIIGMLAALVNPKAALIYFIIAFACSVIFGVLLEKAGGVKYIRNLKPKATCCCESGNSVGIALGQKPKRFRDRLISALKSGWNSLRPILIYLLIGVALGAAIYGYMPQDFVVKIAGPDNPFSIPVAAIIGIPLYIRAETAIPIGIALMAKGMSIGTVIALVIGGAGMAIPEMSMLAGIFKPKLVAAIVVTVFLTAVISGYAFNMFY
ncbi:MAG: permease [Bacteroidales bacterium]|nr:permease [Bacteroidales bacterium]